jgi:DNA repair exonuclease SbcCD ATPase subunit
MTHPAKPLWPTLQQVSDQFADLTQDRDRWKAASKTWKSDVRALLVSNAAWSKGLRKMARRSVEHLLDYHAVHAVLINQLQDTRRIRKALRDLLDAINRDQGEDLDQLMKIAEQSLNGPPPQCPVCHEIEYGHICVDTPRVDTRADHAEAFQEEAQLLAESLAEQDEIDAEVAATYEEQQHLTNQAAEALCKQYLAEFLHLPAGLPGVQFRELTDEGREVWRRLVRIVACELLPDTSEFEKLREED